MFCSTLISPVCAAAPLIGAATGAVANSAVGGIAGAIQSGVAWVVSHSIDWWVQIPSPNLATEPAVGALQRWLLPVTVAVAVVAMLAAAAKMALTRKANPLIDVGSGLAIIAITSALGVLLPSLLLKAGDAWSSWALATSTGGQFGARLTQLLSLSGAATGVVIVLGVVAIIMSAIQAVLMLFRQAALVVLAGVLPLAAAGTLAPATRAWFRKVTSWMLALIFYKPAAAAVYATAFTMIGHGHDPRTVLMGFAMVLLSLLALPALLKFFTWTTGAVEGAAGGGFLSTVVSGAIAVGAVRASAGGPWGGSAADQARLVTAQLGPQAGPGPQPGPGPQGAGVPPGGGSPRPGTGTQPGSGVATPGTASTGARMSAAPSGAASAGTAAAAPSTARAGTGPASAGTAAGSAGTAVGSAGAAAGGAAAGGGLGAAGAAAGPWGAAAAAAASGAAQAARSVADATQPDQASQPDQPPQPGQVGE